MRKGSKKLLALLLAVALCVTQTVPVFAAESVSSLADEARSTVLKIQTQPEDVTAESGETVRFSVEATGTDLTYQWQYSDDFGATWGKSAVTKAVYGTTATAGRHGRLLRCVITDANGNTVTSETAQLLVKGEIKIQTQPRDVTAASDKQAKFSVKAVGTGLKYQWQYSDDNGVVWKNGTGTAASYTTTATAGRHGRLLRCVITEAEGNSVISESARLLVKGMIEILTQPKDVTAEPDEKVKFSVEVAGTGLKYQWQYSDDAGVTWKNGTVTTASYGTTATASRHGRLLRCVITDADGNTVTSETAQLLVAGVLKIQIQPTDVTAEADEKVKFSVVAAGTDMTYRWQYSDDAGVTWKNGSGTASSYTTTAAAARHGRLLRCVITDADGNTVTSKTARLLIKGVIRIQTQPTDVTAESGETVTFSVEAVGTDLTYQWQYSDDNGATWKISAATKATYKTTATSSRHGCLLRCIITDAKGDTVTSEAARLLVRGIIKIKNQPANVTVASGKNATFSVDAAGVGLTYQWQYSDDNGTTWKKSSITKSTYSLTATTARHGRLLRCVVTDTDGNTLTSKTAQLLVRDVIKIYTQPTDVTVESGGTVKFSVEAVGTDLTYQWQYSDDNGETWGTSAATRATYSATVTASRHGRIFRCIITDADGNTVTSETARLLVKGVIKIQTQPTDVTAKSGETVTFSVEAVGTDLTYRWQYSDDYGTSWVTSTITTAAYTTGAAADDHGRLFRCIVTDADGNEVVSDQVQLLIVGAITIRMQPTDVTVKSDKTVTFSVEAVGISLRYQWQYSDDAGVTWKNGSATTANYATSVTRDRHGRMVRCIIVDADGNKVISDSAMIIYEGMLIIIGQPQDTVCDEGSAATFTVEAVGTDLCYQWQYSDDNGTSWTTSTITTAAYTTDVTADDHGRLFRCIVTDSDGNEEVSATAQLLVVGVIEITEQPKDITALSGVMVEFSVTAVGSDLSYQWQYSDDDGATWTNSTVIKATYATNAVAAHNGRLLRCVITDANGNEVVSDSARLLISEQIKIQTQPQNMTVADGTVVHFTVAATGNGLSYQWQYSEDNGAAWKNSAATEAICETTATSECHGYLYRCVITDADGNMVISKTARLLISDLIRIKTQPQDVTAEAGETVKFSVDAIGKDLRYQWQYSDNAGDTWENDIAITALYATKATAARHGRLVRCVITDANGNEAVSDTAKILVAGLLRIIEQPQDTQCSIGDTVQLSVTVDGTGLHYMWQYSVDDSEWTDLDVTENSYTLIVTDEALSRKYRCKVWDDYGSVCVTDTVLLADESNLILVQPENWTCSESSKVYYDIVVSDSVVSCQWQVSSSNGEKWSDSSLTGTRYSAAATSDKNGWLYRCIVTDANGRSQISNAVSLTISDDFSIMAQPTDVSGELGQSVAFKIQVGGTNVTYEWQQWDPDNESWTTLDGDSPRIAQTVRPATIGKYYRCVVTNGDGQQTISDAVRLTLNTSGFFTYNDKKYYAKKDGSLGVGLETIDGDLYYFTASGAMVTGLADLSGSTYYFTEDGSAALGFVYIESKYSIYYFGEDHVAATGWTEINGNTYYFYDTGAMAQGVTQIGKGEYYFDPETGIRTYGMVPVGFSDYMYFPEGEDKPFAGLKEVCGTLYYFSEDEVGYGVTLDSEHTIDGKTYYFDPETKRAITGFVSYNGNVYYMGADYVMVKDELISDGENTYLFNAKGIMQYGLINYNGSCYYFDLDTGAAASGWVDLDGKKYYFDPETHAARTGIVKIDGVNYYFTSDGYLSTGVSMIDGVQYYFAPYGEAANGFIEIDSTVYYVNEDQTVATGLTAVDGQMYYFDDHGAMQTGLVIIDATRYYFDPYTGAAVTGLVQLSDCSTYGFTGASGAGSGLTEINGALYYLSSRGAVQYGRAVVDNCIYYFDPSSGQAVTGWRSIRTSDNVVRKAYFDPESFCAATGLYEIDGVPYYFSANGWAQTGERTINGVTYYFAPGTYEGYISENKPEFSARWGTLDGVKCFYGMDGKPVTGLQTIDGALYYFDQSGKMLTGLIEVDGDSYYFGESGAMHGQIKIDGSEYYFSPSNFVMLTGIWEIDGVFCYYHEDGTRQSGWITMTTGERLYMNTDGVQTGLAVIDGNTYFFDTKGIMCTGMQSVTAENGTKMTCLFGEDGVMVTGFVSTDSGTCYYDEVTGARVTGFAQVNGAEYYFDLNSGRAATGLRNINGVYCYFDPETAQRQYGIQKVNGRIYCFLDDAEGTGLAYGLTVIDGKTYFFDESSGIAKKEYYVHDDVKYYFDPETCASVSAFYRRNNGYVYSFKEGGGLNTGWVEVGGKSYFFYPSTGRMAEGLASVGDKLYYFDLDNGFVRNTTVKVGGITYRLDENGYASAVGDSDIVTLINAGIANLDKGYGDEGSEEEPTTFTCTQFVRNVFGAIGIDIIKGYVYRQYYSVINGDYDYKVIDDIDDAQVGDLVYFVSVDCKYGTSCDYKNELHHVGIYLGDGKIFDSSSIDGDDYNDGPMVRDLVESSNDFIYKMIRIEGVNNR